MAIIKIRKVFIRSEFFELKRHDQQSFKDCVSRLHRRVGRKKWYQVANLSMGSFLRDLYFQNVEGILIQLIRRRPVPRHLRSHRSKIQTRTGSVTGKPGMKYEMSTFPIPTMDNVQDVLGDMCSHLPRNVCSTSHSKRFFSGPPLSLFSAGAYGYELKPRVRL